MRHVSFFVLAIGSLFLLPSCGTTCCSDQPDMKGLRCEILSPGTQEVKPYKNARVTVHYTGYLQNADGSLGKKFDSSVDRGMPFTFNIGQNRVIQGWEIGVMEMKVGEKRRLIIPPQLAYGSRALRGIPANSTLIFDVELLKVGQ